MGARISCLGINTTEDPTSPVAMPREIEPDQESLDILSLMESPHSNSTRRAGNPCCGVCLFPLSKGVRPSNADADPRYESREKFGLKAVEASSSRGCRFCRRIFRLALSCGAVGLCIDQRDEPRMLTVTKSDGTSTRFIFMVPMDFPWRKLPRTYRLCRGRETIKMTSTADDDVLDQAKLWWEICMRKHKCQEVHHSFKPTRLLRLEHKPDNTVIWLVSVTSPVQYVALSHRWSKETAETSLCSSNLQQRVEKGILVTELPRLSKFTFATSDCFIVCKTFYRLSDF